MTPEIVKKINDYFDQFPVRSYPKGQILVFADENPQHIFHLIKGKVRKYDVSYRGDEVIVNIFKPPAFFPMSWAINGTKNKYFYKTEEPTDLHVVPVSAALSFIKENPDVQFDLLQRVYKGMDGLLGRVVHLMSGTAKSRLLYELIIECRRFGNNKPDGSCVLTTTELDFAARSGLSRETVSREMQKLKDVNLVEVVHGGVLIKNVQALENILGGEI